MYLIFIGMPLEKYDKLALMSSVAERANVLKRALIFSGLNEGELTGLAEMAVEHQYTAGEYIFWEGDLPEWFYVLASGRAKAVKESTSGKEVIIAFFGPGEMFGEVAVFENRPYPASAIASVDTMVVAIRKHDFLDFLAKQPEVVLRIINILSGRLRESQGRLRDLAGERVEQRVARILLNLSAKLGNELPFTRQEIADMAGTTVETAIRFMTRLREGGIIRSDRGKIIILNMTKLRLLGQGLPGV